MINGLQFTVYSLQHPKKSGRTQKLEKNPIFLGKKKKSHRHSWEHNFIWSQPSVELYFWFHNKTCARNSRELGVLVLRDISSNNDSELHRKERLNILLMKGPKE